jgi:hypothetical protein
MTVPLGGLFEYTRRPIFVSASVHAVYVPPLATTLPELAGRIRDAVATVSHDLLNNVWTEIEYRYNIWATHDALMERL